MTDNAHGQRPKSPCRDEVRLSVGLCALPFAFQITGRAPSSTHRCDGAVRALPALEQ